jgi:murein DD-endopeptidase MepM/ murein hydrolase activator NlpD
VFRIPIFTTTPVTFFAPSKSTTTLDIPALVEPGSFFIWPRKELNAAPLVGGLKASYILERDQFFAAIGMATNGSMSISGYLSAKHSFFNHPLIFWYHHIVSIRSPGSKKIPELQIPAAVWQKLITASQNQRQQEKNHVWQLTYRSDEPLVSECFQAPLDRIKVVSKFAAPRRLPNGKEYLHTGVDFRARRGTPVKAVAPGIIELADSMVVSGHTILVDHGGGLHSSYFHLDQILKEEGNFVKAGDVIGLAGSSGRAEAPHLHWELMWKGRFLNPLHFLQRWGQICDQG